MKFIVAGTYEQFKNHLRDNNLSLKDYKYVATYKDLFGYEVEKIIFVGTWCDRGDLYQIEREAKERNLQCLFYTISKK